jgi:hypothetical protein
MKHSLFFLTVVVLISWKSIPFRQLRYEDFQGHGTTAALTTSCIDLNYEETDRHYTFSVSCYFVPQESWINVRTPEVLKHESTHYAITVLYARQMERICNTFKNCDSTQAEIIRSMYAKIITEWQTTQAKFDEETNHSTVRHMEMQWEEKINLQIQKD